MNAFLRDFGLTVCTGAVVVGLCGFVVPNRATGRAVRAVLGLYMALILLAPILRGGLALPAILPDGDAAAYDPQQAAAQTDALVAAQLEQTLAEDIRQALLARLGLRAWLVEAPVHIDEGRGIYCDKVVIGTELQYQGLESEARALVEELAAAPTEFRYA